MDKTRNQLKTMNRQFGFYMAQKTAMKNNLIALIDQTYPGANDFFDSPARNDGRFHSYLLACRLRPLQVIKCLYGALPELVQT